MNDPLPSQPDHAARLRHMIEDERTRMHVELAAAKARTPAEWFDIFTAIGFGMVKRELERIKVEDVDATYTKVMAEQTPFYTKVRAILQTHGLPLTEEIEIEGPQVEHDVMGMPHNVSWPRGAWLEIHWPESKGEMLRFEGRCASVALEFLQWWDGFHHVAMNMDGKDESKRRLVDPNSPEYQRYIAGKRGASGG